MNMKNKLFSKIYCCRLLLVLSIVFASSCKKFVDIEPAPDLIETNLIFENDKAALSAALGVYTQLRQAGLYVNNGGLSVYTALSADELIYTGANTPVAEISQNAIQANNSTISTNFWSSSYRVIYQTNAIIEGLSKPNNITDSLKRQLTGEMKVVRALVYFNLVNLFGDVPLILTTDYAANAVMPRTEVQSIYQQIVGDLKEAKLLLPGTYASSGKVRPNKWTAAALLARIYLFNGNWLDADVVASEVIGSGAYGLVQVLNNVFLINSNESIWEVSSDLTNTAEGQNYIPSSTTVRPTFALTATLVNSFETNDQRKTNWLKSNVVAGQTYYYPYKLKARLSTPISEYNIVLRLAEQYLIRAEARAKLNNLSGARSDLNLIRNRANLPGVTTTDPALLLTAIEQENRIEFFCEWGHRWFDLKRLGKADAVLSSLKAPNWQATDALYPIPFSQLQINIFLTQNPGY